MVHWLGGMKTTANSMNVTETQAYEAVRLAQLNEHKGSMASSALLAAQDAAACFNRGDYRYALLRALDSLSYSVGRFHADYAKATAI